MKREFTPEEDLEKAKYFQPDIEDICVGYECRSVNTFFLANEWGYEHTLSPMKKLTREDVVTRFKTTWNVRVAWLTKEQIEAEGWKPTLDFKRDIMDEVAFDKGYTSEWGPYRVLIVFGEKTRNLKISIEMMNRKQWVRYSGECKDINTFRKICKFLKIK